MIWIFRNLSLVILTLTASFIIVSCAEDIAEEPLEIIWTMPSNGYDGLPEPIKIQFNHVIEGTTISNAITISPSLGEIDQRSSSWIDGYTYNVAFAESPEPGKKYTVTIGTSVRDVYANLLPQPYTFSFIYRFGVEYTSPKNGAKNVPLSETIWVWLTYPIDVETCKSAFSISPPVEGEVFSYYSAYYGGRTGLYLYHSEPLAPLTKYTVTIDTTAKASNGEPLAELYTFSFTTEEKKD